MKKEDAKLITVTFPGGSKKEINAGITLLDLSKEHESEFASAIVAAKVDNEIRELGYRLSNDCNVEFIDLSNDEGLRIYRRSLHFLLIKAVHDLFPDRHLIINHSISKGLYCSLDGDDEFTEEEVKAIENRMRQLVAAKIPFVKRTIPIEAAKEVFEKMGRMDRFHAVEHREKPHVTIYSCDGLDDYFYGYMVPHTGYLNQFALKFYHPGLILIYPEKGSPDTLPEFKEQKKLFNIFAEYKNWVKILGVQNVGALNDIVKAGRIDSFIQVAEALHEKKIAQIADMIAFNKNKIRIVLIAGPSSSGKTTFAQRLSIQLRVNGLTPVTISLDDYFLNREQTPRDEKGEYDYEALEAIDVKLFNEQLMSLICGKEVEVPRFNFIKGCRESSGRCLKIDENDVLVIEGIHGLNEKLTASIPKETKFKIYVSALTSMNIDDHNRIPTTDTRIIRRIVRDHLFRGTSASSTIKRWPSVRRGEERNIFPFQEEADVMFNSSLIYELGVLKTHAENLLAQVSITDPAYPEAKRLTEFLSYFLPIESDVIPANSIIREFIGGSIFKL